MQTLATFLSELKRRRVFRVAVVYAGVAFIIIQIIDGAFSYLRIPEVVGTTIIVLLAIGFPIAVALAWAFDITEEGLVRTKSKREPTAAKTPHHPRFPVHQDKSQSLWHHHYISFAILSVLFLALFGCSILDNNDDQVLDLNQVTGFDVAISGEGELEADFFPLAVGTEWTYELVHSDVDTASKVFSSPTTFIVSILDTQTIGGKSYFLVENYFLPGPFLPDTSYMRKAGPRVYVIIEGEEHMLYSFAPEDTLWKLPLYLNPTFLYPHWAKRVAVADKDAAVVTWDLNNFPGPNPYHGRTETGWGDVFNRGLGRVRLVNSSMLIPLIVWDLKKIKLPPL